MGTTYLVQVVESGMSPTSATYREVPVLSFPNPTVLKVALVLAFAQKVSALYPVRSRPIEVTNAPPA